MNFYLSTTADFGPSYEDPKNIGPTAALAKLHKVGLELAEFCIVSNFDERYDIISRQISEKKKMVGDVLLHAPFNELCPAAIDPWIREVAEKRFLQTFDEAVKWGAKKIIVHTGFDPMIYRKEWFVPQSVGFWKKILEKRPEGIQLVLENVMEEDPYMIRDIVDQIGDPQFQVCLDIGHANLMPVKVMDWIRAYGDRISHFHIHNNEGKQTVGLVAAKDDLHHGLGNGCIDVQEVLDYAGEHLPKATITVETTYLEESIEWLIQKSYLK